MRYIQIFEKFNKKDYFDSKKEKERKLIQDLGDEFIIDIVKEGDFEGMNFLLDTGYDLSNLVDVPENLLVVALMNDQMKMFDWLIKDSDYFKHSGYKKGDEINSIHLPDIIGQKKYDDKKHIITPKMIEVLKIITKHGYDFGLTGSHNLIELYLTKSPKWISKNDKGESVFERDILDDIVPFIDWLLKNYSENYPLCKDHLTDKLKKKYKYLERPHKAGLWSLEK